MPNDIRFDSILLEMERIRSFIGRISGMIVGDGRVVLSAKEFTVDKSIHLSEIVSRIEELEGAVLAEHSHDSIHTNGGTVYGGMSVVANAVETAIGVCQLQHEQCQFRGHARFRGEPHYD